MLCSHRKKRMRQINKMAKRGLLDAEKEDPFSLFVSSTNIRYCYYKDTPKILGNTFGMCVLQVSTYDASSHLKRVMPSWPQSATLTECCWQSPRLPDVDSVSMT